MTDKYLNAVYDRRRYNCFHFASDIWFELTGSRRLFGSPVEMRKYFQRLQKPESPSVVVFSGGRDTHIGIFFDGKVFHLNENGAVRERLITASIGFHKLSFYKEKA